MDTTQPPWNTIKGQILLFDPVATVKRAVPLSIEGDIDLDTFNPHGLSLWEEKGMSIILILNLCFLFAVIIQLYCGIQ